MPNSPLWTSLAVFLGAGFGANARYWIGIWAVNKFEVAAIGTLTVNISGSLLMGVVLAFASAERLSSNWVPFLAAGLLGGFTTFSAFSGEVMQMIQLRHFELAVLYMVASVLLSLLACYVGFFGASAILRAF